MGDVAWVNLLVWPWDDAWLRRDPELADAFAGVDLIDRAARDGALGAAMNGSIDTFDPWGGVQIDGEMSSGSYEIRDSTLLGALRLRGIAYRLVGSPKYEWDGDETFWHPGMDAPFEATHTEGAGRVLPEHEYKRMQLLASSWERQADEHRRHLTNLRKQLVSLAELAADLAVKDGGERPDPATMEPPAHMLQAIQRHEQAIARLEEEKPERIPLEVQLEEFFGESFEWEPPAGYQPELRTEEVEADA